MLRNKSSPIIIKMYNILVFTIIGFLQVKCQAHLSAEEHVNELEARREWQYEGLPIDAGPHRRAYIEYLLQPTPTTTTTEPPTTKSTLPPGSYRRIFNADDLASVKDYPFMAALLVNDKLWCGAALIDHDKVLTAAHCLQLQYNNRFFREYVKMLSVRLGSDNATAGGLLVGITDIYFHPNYKPQTLDFNFAILRLYKTGRAIDSAVVNPIPLWPHTTVPNDKDINFLGWGSVLGSGGDGGAVLLQQMTLPIYDRADCQEVYGRDLVTANHFCAGYISRLKNVCNHDAGGPAIMDGMLVGVLSFSNRRCDELDKPAVFSNVGYVLDWITSIDDQERKPLKML